MIAHPTPIKYGLFADQSGGGALYALREDSGKPAGAGLKKRAGFTPALEGYCLEIILQAELDVPRVLYLAGDLTKCARVRDVTARSAPTGMIERVEHFHPEIEILPLGDIELLPD